MRINMMIVFMKVIILTFQINQIKKKEVYISPKGKNLYLS